MINYSQKYLFPLTLNHSHEMKKMKNIIITKVIICILLVLFIIASYDQQIRVYSWLKNNGD